MHTAASPATAAAAAPSASNSGISTQSGHDQDRYAGRAGGNQYLDLAHADQRGLPGGSEEDGHQASPWICRTVAAGSYSSPPSRTMIGRAAIASVSDEQRLREP